METKVYQLIAQSLQARENCKKSNNTEWYERHTETINQVIRCVFPHGSGLDGEHIKLDYHRSTPEKLVFINLDVHHMNDNGFYDGWTAHDAIVTPSLVFRFKLSITGRDRNDIKDYLHQAIHHALSTNLVWDEADKQYKPQESQA